MDLRFRRIELQRLCNRKAAMVAAWGTVDADQVAQRLQELDAVDRLGDLESLPYIRLSQVNGTSVIVVDGGDVQIELVPDGSHVNEGGWRESTAAVIVDVVVAHA